MIVRMVKMTVQEDKIEAYKAYTAILKPRIRAFEGCQHLDLLQDINQRNIFFSYSLWDTEEHLNTYRKSEFFQDLWGKVKPMFKAKTEAWSTEVL